MYWNCTVLQKGEINYTIIGKYDEYIWVDKDVEGSDTFPKKNMIILYKTVEIFRKIRGNN